MAAWETVGASDNANGQNVAAGTNIPNAGISRGDAMVATASFQTAGQARS
jgi:hypothetical protein